MKTASPLLSSLIALSTVLLVWLVAVQVVRNPKLVPSPALVITKSLSAFSRHEPDLSETPLNGLGVLILHTGVTLRRILLGASAGIMAGILCGFVVYSFGWLEKTGRVVVLVLRSIPLLALIPLFVYWFGGKESGIYLYIAFGCFVIMATVTLEAALHLARQWLEMSAIYQASRLTFVRTIVLPAVLPQVLTGLRGALGLSWAFALGAEYLVARSGLGFLCSSSYMYADMGRLACLLMLYGALGLATFESLKFLDAWLCPWTRFSTEYNSNTELAIEH